MFASWCAGFLGALLPARERRRLTDRAGGDPPLWSLLIGVGETFVGLLAAVGGGISYQSNLPLTSVPAGAIRFVGGFAYMSWFAHPGAWVLLVVFATGVCRVAAFVASREAVAEPWIALAVWTSQTIRDRLARRTHRRALGPTRPDRIETEGGDVLVLTCRPKPGWDELATIQIGGEFFRVRGAEMRADGQWSVLAYRLYPKETAGPIYNLVLASRRLARLLQEARREPQPGAGGRSSR